MSAKKLDKKQSEDALFAYIRSTNPHVFGPGGWKDNWTNGNGLGSALGMAGAAASIGSSAVSMANPDTSSVEDRVNSQVEAMKNQRNIGQFDSLDDLMAGWALNRNLSTSFDADDYYNGPSTGDIIKGTLSSTVSGATAGMAAGPWGALAGAAVGLGAGLIGGLTGKSKARDAASEAAGRLASEARKTNNYRQQAYQTMTQNMVAKNNRNLFSQIAAYGGPLGISLTPVSGAIDYMQNEELLDALGESMTKNNNKRESLPMFAFGGTLGGYGGDWSNGLNFIKAGGKHGENPNGGVPMGMAQDGQPNLVEEGEVIWNDYVFSNRIKMPKKLTDKYKLKGDPTFAMGVEQIQKNSSERPNDPIEKRGLEAALAELMGEQEIIRQRKAQREYQKGLEEAAAYAADGGPIHIAKNKKGTFTAAATKHSMGVQEFAGHVLANKDKFSPAIVKKANFARNASKWHHALGGYLYPNGGYIDPTTGEWIEYMSPMDTYINPYPQAERPKSTVPTKPLTQSPINQNPTPIYLPDDSEMNRYTAATNTRVISDSVPTRNAVINSSNPSTNKVGTLELPTSGWQTYLRYAPVLGTAIGLGYTLFNKPDYEYTNELEEAANQYVGGVPGVNPSLLGDYLAYNPFDRLFYANELGAQQASTRSAIMNQSNGNRGQAIASLLAADYSGNIGLGRLFREGEEYNLAQRQKVAEFNRATNQYNSEADLKAQIANAELDKARVSLLLDAKMKALGMKQADDLAYTQNLSLGLSGLFDNLGGAGEDFVNRYDRNALINAGVFGTLSQKPYGVSDKDWENYINARKALYGKCGGRLNRNRKRGLTI